MQINADFSKRAAVHAASEPWVASPMKGVDRRMLDRMGAEVARATSLVRYAPNSAFSAHTHSGGEEFLVLEGVFQDEHGDFPVGTYVRNPPTTSHTPGSDEGCVIFVKLWQFDPDDRNQFSVDTRAETFQPVVQHDGVSRLDLHTDALEHVALEDWSAGAEIPLGDPGGIEILVVDGEFQEAGEHFVRHSWLRLPRDAQSTATAGPQGARIWIKRGHLAHPPKPPAL